MSHISTIQTVIHDLDAFQEACEKRGLQLVRDRKQYRTYNRRATPCDHAVVNPDNPNSYELGLVPAEGGGWTLGYDAWGGGKGMMDKVGPECGGLMQDYGVGAAKRKARKLGWKVREVTMPDGSIRLTCSAKLPSKTVSRGW